jgi:LCP family protein required for cell wall assembly
MNRQRDFWSQDRTTIHQKSGWFGKMPLLQKISYTLLLLFVISWCFYLGMTYSFAIAPEVEWKILKGDDWKKTLRETTGAEVIRLTGTDVVLLVGVDKRPDEKRSRTDTIILAFYNWDTDELKLLSIPRDSYVQFPGRPTKTKINEAYYYGGAAMLESVVEYTFGIEVDHCVELDFAGFLHLIDALGGVEIEVPSRMFKPTEDIDIYPGWQTLNGFDALAFVRFRDMPMGDIDRIKNQQQFLSALAAKIASSTIWKAPELVRIGMEHTTTNYELTDALVLGMALHKTDLSNIAMYSLPGNGLYIGLINYWVLNKNGVIDIITEITGGQVGDFHIISDEGKGAANPPSTEIKEPVEDDDDDVVLPEDDDDNPDEGQETDPTNITEADNTQELPIVQQPIVTPIPEPEDDDGRF